jgi:hypothetical protein
MFGVRCLKGLLVAAVAAAALVGSGAAQASLLGTAVVCTTAPSPNWQCNQTTATVGAQSEFQVDYLFGSSLDVDFGASSVTLTLIGDGFLDFQPVDDLILAGLALVQSISGVTIEGTTIGFDASDVLFANRILAVDLGQSAWLAPDTRVTIDFNLKASSVPEPATPALLAFGLVGVAYFGRGRVLRAGRSKALLVH